MDLFHSSSKELPWLSHVENRKEDDSNAATRHGRTLHPSTSHVVEPVSRDIREDEKDRFSREIDWQKEDRRIAKKRADTRQERCKHHFEDIDCKADEEDILREERDGKRLDAIRYRRLKYLEFVAQMEKNREVSLPGTSSEKKDVS